MSKKKVNSLKELLDIALSSKTEYAEFTLSAISDENSINVKGVSSIDVTGSIRIIDTSGIRHALKGHGNIQLELKRGQIAITVDDFEKVIDVLNDPDNIEYVGKNRLGQDLLKYSRRLDNLLIVIEAIRINKDGMKLVFHTMYKRN